MGWEKVTVWRKVFSSGLQKHRRAFNSISIFQPSSQLLCTEAHQGGQRANSKSDWLVQVKGERTRPRVIGVSLGRWPGRQLCPFFPLPSLVPSPDSAPLGHLSERGSGMVSSPAPLLHKLLPPVNCILAPMAQQKGPILPAGLPIRPSYASFDLASLIYPPLCSERDKSILHNYWSYYGFPWPSK